MSEIDWERYAQLCEDSYAPAIERFAGTLRAATSVATKLSTPVYAGAMKASLVTVLRTMTDILKQVCETQLNKERLRRIRWKHVEDLMRMVWLDRMCRIRDLPIARDYRNTRIHNQPVDYEGLYTWINSLQGQESLISQITRQIYEETALFAREDVPRILELAQLGIRSSGPATPAAFQARIEAGSSGRSKARSSARSETGASGQSEAGPSGRSKAGASGLSKEGPSGNR